MFIRAFTELIQFINPGANNSRFCHVSFLPGQRVESVSRGAWLARTDMLLARGRGQEPQEHDRALDTPAQKEKIGCNMSLHLQQADPDGRRFLCSQRVKQLQLLSLSSQQCAMNPQPSKETPWQPTGTLWTLSNTLWTAKAKIKFDVSIAVAGGGVHAAAFCACPWLTVLKCWEGISPPAASWGFWGKNQTQNRSAQRDKGDTGKSLSYSLS